MKGIYKTVMIKIIGIITLLFTTIFVILGTRENLLHNEGYKFLKINIPVLFGYLYIISIL